MKFKYNDIIQLKENARPMLCLDEDTVLKQSEEEGGTFWSLPLDAFDFENGIVYLKSEYAKRFKWGVDSYEEESKILNINVAYDPIGDVNPGAFCSFINEEEILTIL